MRAVVIIVFVVVYAAMILGRLPGLALDRAGAAVLGALALIAAGTMTVADAWAAADVPTLALLFGLMVISAQLRLGGFYTAVSRALIAASAGPAGLLARVMAAAAALSALLANDIVCLAMTPILVEAVLARGLNPLPYLIGLAMAANIGSAATLIGNPQNMLIGQVASLPFGGYMLAALPSVAAGLAIAFVAVVWGFRGRFAGPKVTLDVPAPAYSPWQSAKGLAALGVCMIVFVCGESLLREGSMRWSILSSVVLPLTSDMRNRRSFPTRLGSMCSNDLDILFTPSICMPPLCANALLPT